MVKIEENICFFVKLLFHIVCLSDDNGLSVVESYCRVFSCSMCYRNMRSGVGAWTLTEWIQNCLLLVLMMLKVRAMYTRTFVLLTPIDTKVVLQVTEQNWLSNLDNIQSSRSKFKVQGQSHLKKNVYGFRIY